MYCSLCIKSHLKLCLQSFLTLKGLEGRGISGAPPPVGKMKITRLQTCSYFSFEQRLTRNILCQEKKNMISKSRLLTNKAYPAYRIIMDVINL